jgi:predicted phage baseplate assembly protein
LAIQVWDGFSMALATPRADAAGQSFYPFGPRAAVDSALMLGFGGSATLTAGPIDLYVRLREDPNAPAPVEHDDPAAEDSLPPPAKLVWEYWDLAQWQQLTLVRDETHGFTRSGHILLRGPGALARLAILGDAPQPLYWLRCRVEANGWEKAPSLDAILINCVDAIQASTQANEVVGRSDGTPGQSFALSQQPVLPLPVPQKIVGDGGLAIEVLSVQLEVDEGGGFAAWQEVEDFHASGPDDPHFIIDRTTAVIGFGDGTNARIPAVFLPAGARGNIVARSYLSGGGRRGNLAAGTITTIQSFIPAASSVTNPYPATGGAEEETTDAAKRRAAATIAANGRAVTAQDFELNAIEAGVRRAKALALANPRYPGVQIPGSVTVIVVPDGDAPNPMPSATTLEAVARALDKVRLITTEIHVAAPTYNSVSIEADIEIRRTADPEAVRAALEAKLNSYLHPLTGGDDGSGWPFGGTIYFSSLYRRIVEIDNVVRIVDGQLGLRVNGELAPFCRDVAICPGELVYALPHKLNIYPEGSV